MALTTLMNERVAIGGQIPPKGSGFIGELLKVWSRPATTAPRARSRDRVMSLWIRAEVQRLTNIRAGPGPGVGTPGPEGRSASWPWPS